MSSVEVDPTGVERWYDKSGRLHREDGPAVSFPSGMQVWWNHGKMHRLSGPAVTFPNGSTAWYVDGKLHRNDGPAMETCYDNGSKDQEWYLSGLRHRSDGPAVILANGDVQYYHYGTLIPQDEFEKIQEFVKNPQPI